MSKRVENKKCIVPSCQTSTLSTPDKIFLHVPVPKRLRELWFLNIGRSIENIPKRSLYCCEDHFYLPQDVINYDFHAQYGGRRHLKPGVLPRYNLKNREIDTYKPITRTNVNHIDFDAVFMKQEDMMIKPEQEDFSNGLKILSDVNQIDNTEVFTKLEKTIIKSEQEEFSNMIESSIEICDSQINSVDYVNESDIDIDEGVLHNELILPENNPSEPFDKEDDEKEIFKFKKIRLFQK